MDAIHGQIEALLGGEGGALGARTIVDRMPGGFFIYRAGGEEELLYANEAVERLFGCAGREELWRLTGGSFRGIVHPEDYDAVEKSIEKQIGESQYDLDYVEYRIIRRDGSVRWVEDYGHYIRDAQGRGLFYVFVADATDKRQKQAEERAEMLESANRELRRRLKIIEGLSLDCESIFYADLEENEIQPYQISDRAADFVQVGHSGAFDGFDDGYIRRWVHPEDRAALAQATDPEQIRQRLARCRSYRTLYRIVDGEKTSYCQLQVADVGEGRRGAQVVLGYRIVDDEILQETQRSWLLENAQRQARAAARAKSTFLANMSHDLRTPMNAVLGHAALARKNLDEREKLSESLSQIEAAGEQMLRFIDDVLELARVESSPAHPERCDLGELLTALWAETQRRGTEKGLRVLLERDGLRQGDVYADREELQQVLERLLTNAVSYTPAGGTVRLAVEEEGAPTRDYAHYHFRVEDTGVGIEREFLPRVFEPFERQKSTTLSGVPGMGLGLAIARSMAEQMGGTLTVDSQVGRGSVFTLEVSLRLAREERPACGEPAPAPARSGAGKILVVEDNEINRQLCVELLEDAGYRTDIAQDGAEAVEKVAAAAPGEYALVLMDIQMPRMDGNAAAAAIRALPDPARAGIPILALSANALEEDRKRSMESGMNGHLAKPIHVEQLLEAIARLLPGGGE